MITYSVDTCGKKSVVKTVTDPVLEKSIYIHYNEDGLVSAVTDDNEREAVFTYDEGRLTACTNVLGETITFTYDADESKPATTITYQAEETEEGVILTAVMTDPEGATTTTFFTVQNLLDVASVGLSAFTIVCSGKQTFRLGEELAGMLRQDVPAVFSKAKKAASSAWEFVKYSNGRFIPYDRQGYIEGGSSTTLVTHRGTNESIAYKIRKGYIEAHYPNPDNSVTSTLNNN